MKDVLKLALEALACTDSEPGSRAFEREEEAITAIKEALAQPEQEPVAWEQFYPDIGKPQLGQEPSITKTGCGILTLHLGFDDLPDGTKFYTTPPKRPWVGLTDEEIEEAYAKPTLRKMYQAIEAKLRELNA